MCPDTSPRCTAWAIGSCRRGPNERNFADGDGRAVGSRGTIGLATRPMPKNILIVEDTDTAATALEIALLSIPDVNVVRVGDGLRALEYLAPETGHTIDALVTDLEMPFLDGFELIRRLRQQERFAMVPIVVVSGDSNPQASERALSLGADAYFAKPWSALEIQKKVQDLLL